jgi:hypothetical protein
MGVGDIGKRSDRERVDGSRGRKREGRGGIQ